MEILEYCLLTLRVRIATCQLNVAASRSRPIKTKNKSEIVHKKLKGFTTSIYFISTTDIDSTLQGIHVTLYTWHVLHNITYTSLLDFNA